MQIAHRSVLRWVFYFVLLMVLSCNDQTKQADKTKHADTTNNALTTNKADNSKYYTTQDTLFISTRIGDTLWYTKQEFNQIVYKHPELTSDYINDPDITYHQYGSGREFGSETGIDAYYILYAYFLKQKNGIDRYAERRKKLIDLYININSLFGNIEYGGTGFTHLERRISGYAEYSINLYKQNENDFYKTYDITRQKALYIQSLRQLVDDEISIDANTIGLEKIKRKRQLNKIVDKIDQSIMDIFYLRRAQEFQYEHYEFY